MVDSDAAASMETLAEEMKGLNEMAYQRFSEIFGPRFRAYFLGRGLSLVDADDLAVTCVSDIALKVGKYKRKKSGSFEAWVMTLARHALVDWWRKLPKAVRLDELRAAGNPAALAEEADPEVVQAVEEAVVQLPETDQAILQLRELGPMWPYEEIGRLLGVSPGTARVRHSRSLRKLEGILGRDPRLSGHLKNTEKKKKKTRSSQ